MAGDNLPFWRTKEFKTSLTVTLVGALVGALAAGVVTVAVNVISTPEATGSRSSTGRGNPSAAPSARPTVSLKNSPATKIDNTGGWGPKRKTFDGAAPYAVLNSIANMPAYGDERNFFTCHDLADADHPNWGNDLLAEDHHTYQCELFADNDISPTFDPVPGPGGQENKAVMLQNTRARVQLPVASTYNPALWGFVAADNSNPSEVWDAVNFIAPKPVTLTYVAGSARLYLTSKSGVRLKNDSSLVGDGALLGDNQDGYLGQVGEYLLLNVTAKVG